MKLISKGKSHKVIKCPYCEAVLEYKGADIQQSSLLLDDKAKKELNLLKNKHTDINTVDLFEVSKFIECPDCGQKIVLETTYEICKIPNLIG